MDIDNIKEMTSQEADAFLFTSRENKYYLASLMSDRGYVLVCENRTYVIVDGRYYSEMCEKNQKNIVVRMDETTSFYDHMENIIEKEQLHSIAIEHTMDIKTYHNLKHNIQLCFNPCDLSFIRITKNEQEIRNIKKACEIVDEVYVQILSYIKVGMSEQEVANELGYRMRLLGAQKEAFEPIVLFAKRGALPHGKPSNAILCDGDFVTMDFGAVYNHYCSDITRSFQVGNIYNPIMENIYDIVLEANKAAIAAIRPGVRCCEIDEVARNVIHKHGYGEQFLHNLGHSIGIQCHEEPNFSPDSNVFLRAGMCLTVEPGIYIDGVGGIRIEDDVLVSEFGCEVLTKADKERIRIAI